MIYIVILMFSLLFWCDLDGEFGGFFFRESGKKFLLVLFMFWTMSQIVHKTEDCKNITK